MTYLDVFTWSKDQIEPFKDAFRGFKGLFIGGLIGLAVLISIFTTLWGLLLVIPGIIKAILILKAILSIMISSKKQVKRLKVLDTDQRKSKIDGWLQRKTFLVDLSFIGWHILALATAGIGYLWLSPYISATKAAFYEQLPKDI